MDILSLLFLAVALAMDAFSAAVTDGMIVKKYDFMMRLKWDCFRCVSVSDALYRKFGVGGCDGYCGTF